MEYQLNITCPLCGVTARRESSGPFIYLDAAGIHAHGQHEVGCTADASDEYVVVRTPAVYRALPDDPLPPVGGV